MCLTKWTLLGYRSKPSRRSHGTNLLTSDADRMGHRHD
jgi:hypothetical protein